MSEYNEFLNSKTIRIESAGFEPNELASHLFDYQKTVTHWALKKGRACIFAGTGMGKTAMQLEWARHVSQRSGPVLILTPLAIAHQTEKEAHLWMDIDQGNTLQYMQARDAKDEKHICPLQLDVIERALLLWSKPGDVVLSPFAGIGSEGYQALKMGRRFIGIELKKSYWEVATRNLGQALHELSQENLFPVAT